MELTYSMLRKLPEKKYNIISLLVIFCIILVAAAFASINELASDSSYYAVISKQTVNEQGIVYEAENIDSGRPVIYPQGSIILNSIGMIFLGDSFNKIIIFLVSISYIFLTWSLIEKSLGLKKSSKIIALVLTAVMFFGSVFFYAILRYKIETFWWIFGLFLIYFAYLVDTKKYGNAPILLMFLFGAAMVSFKQIGLLAVPFLGIVSLYVLIRNGKENLKPILGMWVFFALICAPFYIAMFESTGSLLGNPTQKVPIIDKMEINLFNVPKIDAYYKSDIVPESYSKEEIQTEDFSDAYVNLTEQKQFDLSLQGAMLLALSAISLVLILRKKFELLAISIFATISLSILGFIKIGSSIWFYFINSNFLIMVLILIFTIMSLDKTRTLVSRKFTVVLASILIIVFLVSSFPIAQETYLKFDKNKQMVDDIKNLSLGEGNIFSNRAYEFAYYLDKKVYDKEIPYIDYVYANQDSVNIDKGNYAFLNKDVEGFKNFTGSYNISYIVFAKWHSGYGTIKLSSDYFIKNKMIEPLYESPFMIAYKIL